MNEELERFRQAVADRYTILHTIGRGGVGIVLLAEERFPHRQVAIKVLDPALSKTLAADRFVREVELCSAMGHLQCVPILTAGQAAGLLYYVMPYVAGGSLRVRLQRFGPPPLEEVLRIAQEVAEVLGAVHARGVVHRDVKPDNILLADGRAVVADFGIATALDAAGMPRATSAESGTGTPHYMSPEQVLGTGPHDPRTDVYGLGCTLYEMLCGAPPMLGLQKTVNRRRLTGIPGAHRRRLDEVPSALEQILATALAFFPEDRFASGAEFAAALGSLRRAIGGAPRPRGPWLRLRAAVARAFGK